MKVFTKGIGGANEHLERHTRLINSFDDPNTPKKKIHMILFGVGPAKSLSLFQSMEKAEKNS